MWKNKRLLGVDYGGRRVGTATAAEGIAFPGAILPASEAIDRISRIARDGSMETVVVGLPLNMDGTDSETTLAARSFAGRLAKALPDTEIVLWDERLSSAEAAFALRQAGRSDESDDGVAAAIILQNYLDSLRTACI
jgi:putative holliday junction resolvase